MTDGDTSQTLLCSAHKLLVCTYPPIKIEP